MKWSTGKLRTHKKPASAEVKAEAIALRAQGWTYLAIAKKFDLPRKPPADLPIPRRRPNVRSGYETTTPLIPRSTRRALASGGESISSTSARGIANGRPITVNICGSIATPITTFIARKCGRTSGNTNDAYVLQRKLRPRPETTTIKPARSARSAVALFGRCPRGYAHEPADVSAVGSAFELASQSAISPGATVRGTFIFGPASTRTVCWTVWLYLAIQEHSAAGMAVLDGKC
jgi:hypothetical protein